MTAEISCNNMKIPTSKFCHRMWLPSLGQQQVMGIFWGVAYVNTWETSSGQSSWYDIRPKTNSITTLLDLASNPLEKM